MYITLDGWSFFQDSEETIHSAEKNDSSYESQGYFHWKKTKTNFFLKKKNQNGQLKKTHFPAPPILNIFKPADHMRSMQTNGASKNHFWIDENETIVFEKPNKQKPTNVIFQLHQYPSGKNAFLAINWPFVGQPHNFICWTTSRGRSITTWTRFWLFLTTYLPRCGHFLP